MLTTLEWNGAVLLRNRAIIFNRNSADSCSEYRLFGIGAVLIVAGFAILDHED